MVTLLHLSQAVSVHPGCILTDLSRNVVVLPGFVLLLAKLALTPFFKSVEGGAATQVGQYQKHMFV